MYTAVFGESAVPFEIVDYGDGRLVPIYYCSKIRPEELGSSLSLLIALNQFNRSV